MNSVVHILQFLIGLVFVALGIAKLVGIAAIREAFARLRLWSWLRWLVGLFEVAGGLAMLGSIAQPILTFFAAALLSVILVGALLIHFLRGPRDGWQAAGVLLVGVIMVGLLQPLGLQVLALPKADYLPVEPVANAKVLKTYPAGMWFEGVKVAPDGVIYLSANEGIDLQTGDKSSVRSQLIARAPDGTERTFFRLPKGATAGVVAFGPDGTVYMVGDGSARGVWRLARDGRGELFAKFPEGAWPNGLDLGPDGNLYVSDSLLGTVWRVDTASGAVEKAVEDDQLRRRTFLALAPGANGLHFHGRDMLVAVSDTGTLLKFTFGGDGKLGTPKAIAIGVPGDDFAIDREGVLYVTTHPYNTVVRITPDGARTVVADARHGVTGGTAAAFGTRPGDERTLYVATDGGAFAGDNAAKGALVALQLR